MSASGAHIFFLFVNADEFKFNLQLSVCSSCVSRLPHRDLVRSADKALDRCSQAATLRPSKHLSVCVCVCEAVTALMALRVTESPRSADTPASPDQHVI